MTSGRQLASTTDALARLAAGRRARMADGRPRIDLTAAEARRSAATAMRLAGGRAPTTQDLNVTRPS